MAPTEREAIRWLVTVEDKPGRGQVLRGGTSLIQAATDDGLIVTGDEDGLGLAMLALHERGLIQLAYPLLSTDQGPEVFRGQPAYHLQQVTGVHTLPDGREWVREPAASAAVFNIHGSQIGQLAGHDVNNVLTLVQLVERLEHAVEQADAPEPAKEEARGLLAALKRAARAGASIAHETGVELLAKVLAEQLHIPPGG